MPLFGVQLAGVSCCTGNIGKDDGDEAPFSGFGAGKLGLEGNELFAEGRNCGVDNCCAEELALRIEGKYRRANSFYLRL